jgi:sensor histidine kinase regulating citrate/malate metabolism
MLMQQEQYQNIISGYDQVKKVRHDMINHLIVLDSYLSDSQYNQAVKYIGKLSEELDLSKKGVISNNIIVDALINNSMEKAKKQNITFDYNIFIPNQLMMDDMDLCIVLGNVLDNAIEACDRITEG